jgi:Uma2 family endonuclease
MLSTVSTADKLTYADLEAMPDDGLRHELLGGELLVSPAPVIRHQRVLRHLFQALNGFVNQHGLGEVFFAPVDVHFSPHDVLEPDLLFVRTARLGIVEEKLVRGAPDLVAEVLSPFNRAVDLGAKSRAYRRFGVGEYWIVDPAAETVEVVRRGSRPERLARAHEAHVADGPAAGAGRLVSPLFPGLVLALDEIFQPGASPAP